MYRDVFILASPLQALNALEACAAFAIERPIAILVESVSEQSNSQVRSILQDGGWTDLRPIHIRQGRLRKNYTNVSEVVLALRTEEIGKVFLGFYGDLYLHLAQTILRNGEIYLLDDGVATLSLNHARSNGGFDGRPLSGLQRFARKCILSTVDGFRMPPIETLHYFTIYRGLREDPRNIIRLHGMERLRSICAGAMPNGEAWFLGLGSERIFKTQDLYLHELRRAVSELAPATVRYIPHRYEADEQLSRINAECGVEILRTHAPIELYLSRLTSVPSSISSFVSSALYTVGSLFPEKIRVISFHMNFDDVRRRYHEQFGVIYDYYRACPFIDVVDLGRGALLARS
jgi:hypothetical protein